MLSQERRSSKNRKTKTGKKTRDFNAAGWRALSNNTERSERVGWVLSSLQCRRILGGRKLVNRIDTMKPLSLILWQRKIGESRNSDPYGRCEGEKRRAGSPIPSSLREFQHGAFAIKTIRARPIKTPALQAKYCQEPITRSEQLPYYIVCLCPGVLRTTMSMSAFEVYDIRGVAWDFEDVTRE